MIIGGSGALRKFLEARAAGAPAYDLHRLGEAVNVEAGARRASANKLSSSRPPAHLRLAWPPPDSEPDTDPTDKIARSWEALDR